jgi:hypothetical protein
MISRKSTITIADAYYFHFRSFHRSSISHTSNYSISRELLYDFLYANDFEAWLLNAFKPIPTFDTRKLKEFILQIHTGESLATATPQWSWQQRQSLGQRILKDLSECLIRLRLTDPDSGRYEDKEIKSVDLMQRTLELDGYIYRDNILWVSEETVIEEAEEQGVLESLMTSLKLPDIPTLKHHLELSGIDYQESRWDDSISNSRKVLEGVLSEAAARHSIISAGNSLPQKVLDRPVEIRDYLEHAGILEKKEKEAISSIYGLLSDTGGHPYIAEQDQARLMRHLALIFSQFVLLRLEGFVRAKAK